jgi:hypothetical protein
MVSPDEATLEEVGRLRRRLPRGDLIAGVHDPRRRTAIAAVAVMGVPDGVRGIPLTVPATGAVGLLAGAAVLGLAAGVVTARLALRVSPAAAMRLQE